MKLNFKIDQVESLIQHTKQLVANDADIRDGFDEPGLVLASQYGEGVYLMSSMADDDDEWTARLVFAEHSNPNAADYRAEVAVAAYGEEETAELIPLATIERMAATIRDAKQEFLIVSRTASTAP